MSINVDPIGYFRFEANFIVASSIESRRNMRHDSGIRKAHRVAAGERQRRR